MIYSQRLLFNSNLAEPTPVPLPVIIAGVILSAADACGGPHQFDRGWLDLALSWDLRRKPWESRLRTQRRKMLRAVALAFGVNPLRLP